MTQPNWKLTGQEDWQPSDWTYQRNENGFGMSYDVPAGQEAIDSTSNRPLPLDTFDIPNLGTSFPEIFPGYFPAHSQSNFSTWAQPHPGCTTSQPSWQPNGHVPIPDLYLTNIPNAGTDYLPNPPLPPRHYCLQPNCNKHFIRKGDLTRHVTTAHQRPASFLCHVRRCPRGIPGKGFARKDKLVDHLTSKKHGMSKVDAMYEATLHNA